jgi:hypothetical protein
MVQHRTARVRCVLYGVCDARRVTSKNRVPQRGPDERRERQGVISPFSPSLLSTAQVYGSIGMNFPVL